MLKGCARSFIPPLVILLTFMPVWAGAMEYEGLLAAGYDWGGNELVNMPLTNGKQAVLYVNEGYTLSGGIMFYNTTDLQWQTQTTIGTKYRSIDADNGGAVTTGYSVEAIQFFNTELIRVGLGLTYVIHLQTDTNGAAAGYSADFDNTFGLIAEIGFKARKKSGLFVDLRYTSIKFSGTALSNGQTQPISGADGSSLGVQIGYVF